MNRPIVFLFFGILLILVPHSKAELAIDSCPLSSQEKDQLTQQTISLFYHAYNSYKKYALPHDELLPLSCSGTDTFGGIAVSLIDTLDTLVLIKDYREFVFACKYIRDNVSFDVNNTVSVFETTIRVVGGLLSAHGILTEASDITEFDAWLWYPNYDDSLLYLAYDLVERLMPVFNTPTGIPYGSIHLQHGVSPNESLIASTAGAGSLILEFGTLTRLTRDPKYYRAAFGSMLALHSRAANTGLVGNHIHIETGRWTATEAGVGGLIDSFYEYMMKGYVLFGDSRLLMMFLESYDAISKHLSHPPWILDADMSTGRTVSASYSSLAAFFAGLQAFVGEGKLGEATTRAHYATWRKYGALPEGYDVLRKIVVKGQSNYPLRPELIEAAWYLYQWSGDPIWQGISRNILASLELTKRKCGLAEVLDVPSGELTDRQHSFVMSETLKYLYLLLTDINWGKGQFVLTTEAHPLRIVAGVEHIVPEAREKIGVGRVKCRRRKDIENRLPCGYSMSGTDHVEFGLELATDPLAGDVLQQVEAVVRNMGLHGLPIGHIFKGKHGQYKVVRIENSGVIFEQIKAGNTLGKPMIEGCKKKGWGELLGDATCRTNGGT